MKRAVLLFLLAPAFLLLFTSSAYTIPNLISYQGVLNDGNGVPLSDTKEMVFSIYTTSSGGTALWTETQSVMVSNGLIHVQLGSFQQLPSTVFSTDSLYLGIKVGTDAEMTPRQRITAGPYVPAVLPVGTIMAWAKNLAGVPALIEGWAECNGQTVSDITSPLNGTVIPNLNGENRFLRGGNVSGEVSGEETHKHFSPAFKHIYLSGGGDPALKVGAFGSVTEVVPSTSEPFYQVYPNDMLSNPIKFTNTSQSWQGASSNAKWEKFYTSEVSSRPPSYGIVWIMKIK